MRVTASVEVTAAMISMRPPHRPHSRTSFRNTRHISDAHGTRPGRLRWPSPAGAGSREIGEEAAALSSTIPDPGRESGRQHPEVPGQVRPWARHDRDEPLDNLVWREHERRRAITPGPLEAQFEAAVVELEQPLGGDGRARQVASHALETFAVVCPNARRGLEVVPFDLRAQLSHHERIDVDRCAADADDPASPARASRDDTASRCLGDRGQDGCTLNEARVRSIGLAIG